ncbi:hypothetical protein ABPG72_019539 [Tetrahymena utriculariae]
MQMSKKNKLQIIFQISTLFLIQSLKVQCDTHNVLDESIIIKQNQEEQIDSGYLSQKNHFQKNFRLQQLSSTNCTQGEYLYQVTQNYSVCLKCQVGCSQCCDTNFCMLCLPYYYLNQTTSACQKCSQGCIQCQNQNACQLCEQGTYLDQISLQCQKCPDGCIHCTSSKECKSCVSGYYLPYPNMVCKQCQQGCANCNNDNAGTCIKCLDYYTLKNNQCQSCPQNCIQCDQFGLCLICDTGLVNINSQCVQCSQNCLSCSQTTNQCEKCIQGYYFDVISLACTKCKNSKCQTCLPTNSNQCISCNQGYQLVGHNCINCQGVEGSSSFQFGVCTKCGTVDNTCNECTLGYYQDSVSKFCSKCPTSCNSCISNQVCITCKMGFYLSQNKCIPCAPNCVSCNSKTECKQCINGMYFKGNRCTPCADYCQKCQGNVCLKCIPGYILNGETCRICTEDVCTCDLKQIYAKIEVYLNYKFLMTYQLNVFIMYFFILI